MRTNKKLITSLSLLVMMLLASIFCLSVFAEADGSDEPDELTTTSAPAVSGCDLKKEDLQMAQVNLTGFKMLVPSGNLLTIESDAETFSKSEFDRNTLIGENVFFYFNTNKTNYCQVYAGMVELSPLEKYYGDYSKLTKAQQEELLAKQISDGDTSSKGSFEKINGRTYMLISNKNKNEEMGDYVVYGLYTVIGDYKYIVQIVTVNPDKQDLQVVNEMLNSVKIGGMSTPMSAAEIALIVCTVLLLAAVAFAIFTLYRIDSFIKTGSELKSVFGFDLPVPAVAENDEDNDDDGDDDDFEDEAADDADDAEMTDSDEKIVDDESDSE